MSDGLSRCRRGVRRWLPGAALALAWACVPLRSVAAEGPPGAASGAGAEAERGAGQETEAETIRRCLADVRSPDVRLRRRAVMILGKYRAVPAMNAVVASLRDEDEEVRRSAAVAVAEWDVLPAPAQSEVLRLLVDPSVQVRRVASSMLPDVLGGRLALGGAALVVGGDGEDVVLAPGRPPAAETAALLNRALSDEDLTVRRNVLNAARYLPGVLRRESLEPCLRDPDREVRLAAIQAYSQLRGDERARAEVLAAAATDPDSAIRREAAAALGRLGAAGTPALERLAADADPGVRVAAARELIPSHYPRGLALLERCLTDETIPAEDRGGLLVYAGLYGQDAKALLTRLSADRSPALRAEALRALARLNEASREGPGFFLQHLSDESPEVRRTAAQGLLRWAGTRGNAGGAAGGWPRQDDLVRLLGSPFQDVRLLAVRLSGALPEAARLEVLTEACLDDDPGVRCEAIASLAMAGEPAALDLVARSLDDPKPEVVLAAVRALSLQSTPRSREILQGFHDRCGDPSLKAALRAVLDGMGGGDEPVRIRPSRWPLPRPEAEPPAAVRPSRGQPGPRVPPSVPGPAR